MWAGRQLFNRQSGFLNQFGIISQSFVFFKLTNGFFDIMKASELNRTSAVRTLKRPEDLRPNWEAGLWL